MPLPDLTPPMTRNLAQLNLNLTMVSRTSNICNTRNDDSDSPAAEPEPAHANDDIGSSSSEPSASEMDTSVGESNSTAASGSELEMDIELEVPLYLDYDQSSVSTSSSSTDGSVKIPGISSVKSTQSKCFVCGKKDGRIRVPPRAILGVWVQKNIRIPALNRCCKTHLKDGKLTEDALVQIQPTVSYARMTIEENSKWILSLTEEIAKPNHPVDSQ
jgi:hypothetical protein